MNDKTSKNSEENKRKAIKQKQIESIKSLLEEISNKIQDKNTNLNHLIYSAQKSLYNIQRDDIGYREPTLIKPVITEAYQSSQDAASRTDGISGIRSGFVGLDKMTSGWQNSDLIVIAARPAMGKTAFILSMALNIALNSETPVALFSLEMSNAQLVNRLIANICEIPGEKIKSGQLHPYEWAQLDYKLKSLTDAPLFIDDSPKLSIEELCDKAHFLVKESGVKLIILDYIQLLYNEVKFYDKRYPELNYFTRRLKSLAKELNIPIIVVSQLNRNVESRDSVEGKRPQLTDLRDSGTLCDDADLVCFIHRPEYYKIFQGERGEDYRGMAEFIIAKHRNGATGDVLLRFKSEFARFQNPDDDTLIVSPYGTSGRIISEMNWDNKNNEEDGDISSFIPEGPIPF